MTDQAALRDYWNSRAALWENYDAPLIPSQQELDFQQQYLKRGDRVLILGATPELCRLALESDCEVTAVDFAKDIIEKLELPGVHYICDDWQSYLERSDERFDTIMSDGGLNCLEFSVAWQGIARQLPARLKPQGVFSPRIYINTLEPPQESYENPNLNIFVTSMGRATLETNWNVHIQRGEHKASFSFPPASAVQHVFGQLELLETLVPDCEEGDRFVSYAWRHSGV